MMPSATAEKPTGTVVSTVSIANSTVRAGAGTAGGSRVTGGAVHARTPEVPDALTRLARDLLAEGALIGSHDDNSAEDRARARAMGARLAEFPETLEAARAAHAGGDAVVMGAPNVVRGGSHDRKVAAEAVIAEGLCNALVSDYHYPAPRQAAFALAERGAMDLSRAWGLISAGPATVMGWTDRGHLGDGARADLVIVEADSRRIGATIAGGRITYLAHPLAARFF